jgi:hypothetical protein
MLVALGSVFVGVVTHGLDELGAVVSEVRLSSKMLLRWLVLDGIDSIDGNCSPEGR